jgi:hypothetical protein
MCQLDAAAPGTTAAKLLLQRLDQLLPAVQQQLGPRQLSNIIWACAYAKHIAPVSQLLSVFVQHETLSAANSQDIANILWALGQLGQQVPAQQLAALLTAFTAEGVLGRATAQGISIVLLGMVYLGQRLPAAQLGLLLAALTVKSDKADPQALSNSLWAVAKLGQQVQDKKQLQQLVAALISNLSKANTQAIANTLWAVSEMHHQVSDEHLDLMLAAFVKQLHKADPQHVSNTLLACARFRHVPESLVAALEKQQQGVQQFLAAANPQNVANAAWAFGLLGHNSQPLLRGLLGQAVQLLQQDSSTFTCQALCNLCWAVAVLDLRQYMLAVLRLAEAASRVWGLAVPKDRSQLYQVHMWLLDNTPAAAKGVKALGLLQVLSAQQMDECRKAWQDQVAAAAAAVPSKLQQEVFAALEELTGWQVPPKQEQRTCDKTFSIDIFAVTAAGARLAVEVDGPSHFVSPGNRVNGRTEYRDRALKARGYTVVSIPWWEWEQRKGRKQQQAYLVNKLKGETVLVGCGALQLFYSCCGYG